MNGWGEMYGRDREGYGWLDISSGWLDLQGGAWLVRGMGKDVITGFY